ncbi:MAG: Gfo/Idh/MocA family protein [Coraliomargaritaceae bacterium]
MATAAFPHLVPSRLFGAFAPSKQCTLGFIGVGGQGVSVNLTNFLSYEDCRVLSVCDAFLHKAERACKIVNEAYNSKDCTYVQDFREVLADPRIDAVVISTPDHWHIPMSLLAMKAGKHVFCEKPTQSIHEGRQLVDAFNQSDLVFQAGIEDRSKIHFHKLVEWVKNGAIGTLEEVEVIMPKGKDIDEEKLVPVPEDLDWNLWQGPAEYRDFSYARTNPGGWRQIGIYSKGTILDIGTHLVDTAQIGINDPDACPVEVRGSGYTPTNHLTDVPVEYDLRYRYGNGVQLHVRHGEGIIWDPKSCFIEFRGSHGWVRRDGWGGPLEASDKKILRTRYNAEENKHWPKPPREQRNFVDCIRSGKPTTYTPNELHKMCTTLHMGVLAIQLGRKLHWDPKKETFINDIEANRLRYGPPARNWQKA